MGLKMLRNLKSILFVLFALTYGITNAITYHGGGVLPYAVNPKNNKVYFLFAQEGHGASRGYWADFGGRASKKDKNNPIWIAAREFSEESNELFGSYKQTVARLKYGKDVYRFDKSSYASYL